MLIVFVATIVLTVGLYIKMPKGYFPQDDTGLIFGGTKRRPTFPSRPWRPCSSRRWMLCLPTRLSPASARRSALRHFNAAVNFGRLFISLKPLSERGGL